MPTIVVSGAIFDEHHRIVCVRQNYGGHDWSLPGGGLEPGESPTDAVEREIREETGYRCRVDHLIGAYSSPWKESLGLLFQADVLGRDPWEPDDEITAVASFARDDLPEPMTPRMRTRIEDALDGQRGIVRTFPFDAGARTVVPRPTLVLMAGPPGAGKSALALAISRALGWPVIDKDTLKSAALDAHVPEEIAGKLSYDLLFAVGRDLLLHQQLSVILDSPAGYRVVIEWATELAARAGTDLKVIVCTADRDVRNNRLRERVAKPSQWLTDTLPDDDSWQGRLAFFSDDALILNTVRPLAELTAEAISYLRRSFNGWSVAT